MDPTMEILPIVEGSRVAPTVKALPLPILRAAGDDSPAMICRIIFDELTVHANGDIVCSCADPTGIRVYGNVFVDRIADVYNGVMYREMRDWQLRSAPDSFCPVANGRCPGRVSRATAVDEVTGRVIKYLQLEPVSYCNLRCPSCPVTTHFEDAIYEGRGYRMLPLEVMLDVIDQLPELDTLLFYNFGEPFLHKDAIQFLRTVKQQRPHIYIATNTNGLVFTSDQIEALANEALIDKIVFSIDGADPDNYRIYRVGGDLSKALYNMKTLIDASKAAGTHSRIEFDWQYILFEWNDTDEELARAREIAREIGVPIKWMMTHTVGASRRFLPGSREFERLCEGDISIHPMSCGLQLDEFWQTGGVSKGRYLASISADVSNIEGVAGEKVTLTLRVENKSGQDWRVGELGDRGVFRLGAHLRTPSGRKIKELPPMKLPVDAAPAGGVGSTTVSVTLPNEPGQYQVLFDVVEEWVCWFFERGSQPLVIRVNVR